MSIINIKYVLMGAMALLLGSCGGEDSGAPSQLDSANGNIIKLQVTPANSRIPVGFEQQLVAQALTSDGTAIDVTTNPSMTWSSSDAGVASVDNQGLVTGINIGTATIRASGTHANGSSFEATAQVEVTSATVTGLQVTPATARVPVGFTQVYVATALFSDNSALIVTNFTGLTWNSSDTTTASISNDATTKGHATGIKEGTLTITASGNVNGQAFSASAELVVTGAQVTALQVTPANATMPVGLTEQFIATAILSDGSTRDVTHEPSLGWSSNDTSVAVISNTNSNKGLATGAKIGTAIITASGSAGGISFTSSAHLTVTDAVPTRLIVTPITAITPAGLTQIFTATLEISDGSVRDVTHEPTLNWVSSDTTIATISSLGSDKGTATGVKPGTVNITASGSINGSLFSASAELTVANSVATQLVVTPTTASTPVGLAQQFIATLSLSDGTTRDVTNDPALSWVSGDPSIATIVSSQASGNGLATGVNTGTVTITASGTANGTSFTADTQLTVTAAVPVSLQVTPDSTNVPVGLSQSFTANLTLSDGSVLDVTQQNALSWSSSDPTIASISSSGADKGSATGVSLGAVTITASGSAGGTPFSATAQLTVTAAVPVSLQVTPVNIGIPVGLGQRYTASLTLSDGSVLNVTQQNALNWSSSDPTIATISSSGGDKGHATGVRAGTVTITASGITGGVPFSATALLKVKNVSRSQIFGAVGIGDQIISYLLDDSRLLSFRCGSIVDAMGTPEGGMTGGTGGVIVQASGDNVVSLDVEWGTFYLNPGFTSISKIVLRYSDNTTFQCGNSINTSSVQSGHWDVPLGETFEGFIISAQRYTHALQVASISE